MMPLKIEKLYAWIAEDDDGQQGVIGFLTPDGGGHPLVGADMARIESYRGFIEKLAVEQRKTIFLMEFSTRTILQTICSR